MTFCCKGVCDTLETDVVATSLRYTSGQKRCSTCSIFIQTTALGCPCCGTRLRTKSRHRQRLKKMITA